LAVMVILLHSVIAHEHVSEMSDVEHFTAHKNPASVFDTIALSFHVDSGSGHLENFVEQVADGFGHDNFVNDAADIVVVHSTNYTYSIAGPGFTPNTFKRQTRSLRAPPKHLI
jgi:hypothetical protein